METAQGMVWPVAAASFEPSYEGWKHFDGDGQSGLVPSFEPSYEGWKLSATSTPVFITDGFEPSYEGWKPKKTFPVRLGEHVLSLPTRDGNHRGGIEMKACAESFEPSYEGWKPNLDIKSTVSFLCFEPSYEGWKLRNRLQDLHSDLGFEPSYEGWKLRPVWWEHLPERQF